MNCVESTVSSWLVIQMFHIALAIKFCIALLFIFDDIGKFILFSMNSKVLTHSDGYLMSTM